MNTAQLLQKLRQQLKQLEQEVLQHDNAQSAKDLRLLEHLERFEQTLFHQSGGKLHPCIIQLESSIQQLERQLAAGISPLVLQASCERIADRFVALKRAIATTAIDLKAQQQNKNSKKVVYERKLQQRHQESGFEWIAAGVMRNSHQLYEELNKHLNWEKKIQFKIEQLQAQLDICHITEKIAIQNDLLAMHKRLGKCRQAINYIEDRIQLFERPNKHS
ncbi:primosomal replication protein [Shewanella avicenniae]|uniref:Primosomal replication protein n=1 Tax=Shewanella avicenniae TaxID=2814294 RepID=A0ABX7QVR8_9GAMM|nr:primosomal replication protein [Shewanella avicenniae]QSX34918.1 primosomal replication protein [Shewanella avicenniae]